MFALGHAVVIDLLLLPFAAQAHSQQINRAFVTPTTISVDFYIATAPNSPAANMGGAIYDIFAASTASAVATTVIATATATASATAAAIAAGSPNTASGDDENGECKLLGSFAIFVQLALGGLALLSLVYKRWRERPQRPVKIWFFDVSKQVFGSVLVHMANVFMSMLTSGRISVQVEPASVSAAALSSVIKRVTVSRGGEYVPNPCSFYLLNLAIDTTVGIPILILLLRIFTKLVSYTPVGQPPESIQSGHYGSPPSAWWWFKQSVIYFLGLFGMKFCVLVIFLVFPWISRVGDWALRWTEGNEKIQIVFVMMLFPLIMNALQYYIIDSFIKNQGNKDDSEGQAGVEGGVSGSGNGSGGEGYQRVHVDEDREDGSDDNDLAHERQDAAARSCVSSMNSKKTQHEEYDPEVDGDRTVSGSSRTDEGRLSAELLPKE